MSEASEVSTGQLAWRAWAEREIADPQRRVAAVEAAYALMQTGAGSLAGAVAARLSAGQIVPEAEARALWDELHTLDRVSAELATIQPSGHLTEAALAELQGRYTARVRAVRELYGSRLGEAPAGAPAPLAQAASAAPKPPGPSMREFFGENSILIISIAGAFLLIVATLLFEIYGTTGLGGDVRFTGVLILNLIFGAAGYLCFGRPRLRVVGQTYLAIFALMTPLTIAAAWVFLTLESRGISRELALGMGGLGCCALYAVLAIRLQSRGYAALSMVALAVGWVGLLLWAHAGVWMGAWLAPLAAVYIAVAYPPARLSPRTHVFTGSAEPFIHAAAVLTLGWAMSQAISEWNLEVIDQTRPSLALAAAFALLTVAYAAYCRLSRRTWMLWTVWSGTSFAILATTEPLGLGERGYVVELAVLAWAYAIGQRWTRHLRLRTFVRYAAAFQAAFPILLSASPDGLQALALLATSGIGVFFAVEAGASAWLLLAAAIFGVDWFWLAKSLLPPPAQATPDTLVLTYSPLPALYALVGLGLRLSRGRRWAWPLYAAGGLVAVGVVVGAASQGDLTLAGRALMVYAGAAYVAAAFDRWIPGVAAAVGAAAVALLLLLAAASAATYWYPLAMTALAVAVYATHLAWRDPGLVRAHRFSGMAIAALTALSCYAVLDFWLQANPGALTALAAVVATAALLLADGRRHGRPVLDYVAAAVASLGATWIARYAGAGNLQAEVALTGIVLVAIGLIAPQDERRPATLTLCRIAIGAGTLVLFGASAYQSVTEEAAATYTTVWVIEAVLAMLIGIGARSRTLVLAGGAGLAFGALRALFLILQSVQVYVVFGVIAILLLIAAGVLAATRDRLSAARSSVARSWVDWT